MLTLSSSLVASLSRHRPSFPFPAPQSRNQIPQQPQTGQVQEHKPFGSLNLSLVGTEFVPPFAAQSESSFAHSASTALPSTTMYPNDGNGLSPTNEGEAGHNQAQQTPQHHDSQQQYLSQPLLPSHVQPVTTPSGGTRWTRASFPFPFGGDSAGGDAVKQERNGQQGGQGGVNTDV